MYWVSGKTKDVKQNTCTLRFSRTGKWYVLISVKLYYDQAYNCLIHFYKRVVKDKLALYLLFKMTTLKWKGVSFYVRPLLFLYLLASLNSCNLYSKGWYNQHSHKFCGSSYSHEACGNGILWHIMPNAKQLEMTPLLPSCRERNKCV